MFSEAVRLSLARILSQGQWRSVSMVTRYDVISSKWSSNTFYESKNFSDSSVHHILESENFSFPFSERNWVTWVKYKI